jgi:hypothetical protein
MALKIPVAIGGTVLISSLAQPVAREVRVDAGPHDRRATVVSFAMPGLAPGSHLTLRDGNGWTPLQVDADARGWFVAPAMKAGATRSYRVEEGRSLETPGPAAGRHADNVHFTSNGKPVLQYVGGPGMVPSADIKPIFARGGYLHPVRTPSGRIVTDDYPADHRHHHGIWFAWTKASFQGRDPDFWNMGDGKARVEFAAIESVWNGPVQAGVRAHHRYVDLTSGTPVTVLNERWVTRVYELTDSVRPYHVFDVEVVQSNVAGDPLLLPEYHYGGIGVRGAAGFVKPDIVQFLTSEGKDRLSGDGTESRWAVISGEVDGQQASLAILAHPSNFRAPERMRIHPTDPYLCFAPSRSGPWSIGKGASHAARYRFVAFDGPPDPAELRRLWVDYAQPPAASVR